MQHFALLIQGEHTGDLPNSRLLMGEENGPFQNFISNPQCTFLSSQRDSTNQQLIDADSSDFIARFK